MKKNLSIISVIADVDESRRVFADIKELEEQKDIEKMNAEIHKRINWFINGIAMQKPATLISVSHSIF